MQAKTVAIIDFERVLTAERVEIRDPRARPSNIWWNIITIKRLLKAESPETTVVTPITGWGCQLVVSVEVGW